MQIKYYGGWTMSIVKSTTKGQILIPAPLRRKYHIVKNTPLHIYDEGNKIVIEPVGTDPVQEGRGLLATKGRVLKALLADRKKEAER
jgi:AbrB family looped-hinge helix DNA binding protein